MMPETCGEHAATMDALLKRVAARLELQSGEMDALLAYIGGAVGAAAGDRGRTARLFRCPAAHLNAP